jgi:hypothetical protein
MIYAQAGWISLLVRGNFRLESVSGNGHFRAFHTVHSFQNIRMHIGKLLSVGSFLELAFASRCVSACIHSPLCLRKNSFANPRSFAAVFGLNYCSELDAFHTSGYYSLVSTKFESSYIEALTDSLLHLPVGSRQHHHRFDSELPTCPTCTASRSNN